MSNSNVISSFIGGTGRNQLKAISGDLSTASAFVVNTDTSGTTAPAILRLPTQTAILGSANARQGNAAILGAPHFNSGIPRGMTSPFFASDSFDGVPFKVRLAGTGTMGANGAQTLQVNLVVGTSSTIGSDTVIRSTGTALATVAGGAVSFLIEAFLLWSSGVGTISGFAKAVINFVTPTTQVTVEAAIQNGPVAAALYTDVAFMGFATAGNAASSTIQPTEFSLERV